MKITKKQLKLIIKEAMENLDRSEYAEEGCYDLRLATADEIAADRDYTEAASRLGIETWYPRPSDLPDNAQLRRDMWIACEGEGRRVPTWPLKEIIQKEAMAVLSEQVDPKIINQFIDLLCNTAVQNAVLLALKNPAAANAVTTMIAAMGAPLAKEFNMFLKEILPNIPGGGNLQKDLATFLNSEEAKPLITAAFAAAKVACTLKDLNPFKK